MNALPLETQALSGFDLDSLTMGAARLRPQTLALHDLTQQNDLMFRFVELNHHVDSLAWQWSMLGLPVGARVLISMRASSLSIIGLLGALRAGLDVVLAPLHANAGALAALARQTGALALASEPSHDRLNLIETLFAAAALASDVRLVCSLGAELIDDAVCLDPWLAREDTGTPLTPYGRQRPQILTQDRNGQIHAHDQAHLIAAALDLATRGKISGHGSVLSCLLPASFAGLVAGPILSLLTGAPLMLIPSFSTDVFARAFDAGERFHLIVPAAATLMMLEAGVIDSSRLISFMPVTPVNAVEDDAHLSAPILARHASLPIITDLYAMQDRALIAEPRGRDGKAKPPAESPHFLPLDGQSILAVTRTETGQIEGLAVTAEGSFIR
ncbi:MAG: hypothetical protein EBY21_07430 [Alphaproteobacteria bacterium]|nr:hypothetical protein [Alphaproteobacteria bacterium]